MQQETRTLGLVPVLSTQAGSCLTLANWEAAGVTSVSFNLIDLLMKPGLAVLNKLYDIRDYYKWPYKIILNAMLPAPDREDVYSFRSHYDGSLIRIDTRSLFALIGSLKPDAVMLPKGSAASFEQFRTLLPAELALYFHSEDTVFDAGFKTYQYRVFESGHSFSLFLDSLKRDNKADYLTGDFDFQQLKQIAGFGKYLIETDIPAKDGEAGVVYSEEGAFNILDSSMTNDSRSIDQSCQCQTCRQLFTRAYLHHLLQQTPLLAQRYLVQHNIWTCQNYLSSFTSD